MPFTLRPYRRFSMYGPLIAHRDGLAPCHWPCQRSLDTAKNIYSVLMAGRRARAAWTISIMSGSCACGV